MKILGKVMVKPLTYLLKKTLFKKRLDTIKKSLNLYNDYNNEEIINFQIKKFNYFWEIAYRYNSFYKMWKSEHKLPNKIFSISEIKDFPVLNKTIINDNYDLVFPQNKKFRVTFTGGTSGITTKFPTNETEAFNAYIMSYTGRSWWNIEPLSEILMLWGHSHLFKGGLKGKIQYFKRMIKDYIINTKRISSYNLSETNLNLFFKLINDLQPTTMISYSGNIFKLAKFMDENNLTFKFGKIQNIIVTSETLYSKDIEIIKKKFAYNVINEYGMAETGVIGYSKNKTQNINIFWSNFILTQNKNCNLYLSTLSDRVFPLINYDTEDKAVTKFVKGNSILSLKEIVGKSRNNLPIKLRNGSTISISTIFFDHFLKYFPNIYSVQYKILKDEIHVVLNTSGYVDVSEIYKKCIVKLSKDFGVPDAGKLKMKLGSSTKTIAGKHSIFIQ